MRVAHSRIYGPYDGRGFVLELEGACGSKGRGECAPLAGYSRESLDEAQRLLEGVCTQLADFALEAIPPGNIVGLANAVTTCLAPVHHGLAQAPSARFALETALCDLFARSVGSSLAFVLGARVDAVVTHNAMVDLASPTLTRDAIALARSGYASFKAKVGRRPFADELAAARRLRAALGANAELRFDANGAWGLEKARAALNAYASLDAAYIEEPTRGEALLELGGQATGWAADESLEDPALADRLLRAEGCAVFVLKPARLGLFRAHALAQCAHEAGLGVVITHMRDGRIGLTAARALALSLAPNVRACGLTAHADLAPWPEATAP